MDTRRLLLYGALGLILFMLWSQWRIEHPLQHAARPVPATIGAQTPVTVAGTTGAARTTPVRAVQRPQTAQLASLKPPAGPRIQIHTDVLEYKFIPMCSILPWHWMAGY